MNPKFIIYTTQNYFGYLRKIFGKILGEVFLGHISKFFVGHISFRRLDAKDALILGKSWVNLD